MRQIECASAEWRFCFAPLICNDTPFGAYSRATFPCKGTARKKKRKCSHYTYPKGTARERRDTRPKSWRPLLRGSWREAPEGVTLFANSFAITPLSPSRWLGNCLTRVEPRVRSPFAPLMRSLLSHCTNGYQPLAECNAPPLKGTASFPFLAPPLRGSCRGEAETEGVLRGEAHLIPARHRHSFQKQARQEKRGFPDGSVQWNPQKRRAVFAQHFLEKRRRRAQNELFARKA